MKEPAAVATCLCGAVRISVSQKPRSLTHCNCTVCRSYGTLWSYYTRKSVTFDAKRGALGTYSRPGGSLRFGHCTGCGCVTHWESPSKAPDARIGINARLMEQAMIAKLPIKILDGDKTWKTLGRYVRPELFLSPHRARVRSR